MSSELSDLDPSIDPSWHFPQDARGTCLVIGTPSAERKDEPIPVDLIKSLLFAVTATREMFSSIFPLAKTRVEVIGALPREFGRRHGTKIATIVKESASGVNGDGGLYGLEAIERERAAVVSAIMQAYGISDDEVEVISLSDKLGREPDAQASFIESVSSAQRHLRDDLDIEVPERKKGGEIAKRHVLKVLTDHLRDLIPERIKKGSNNAILDRLVSYALVEILWIIRKARKHIVLLHYLRERRYLPVARAYMATYLGLDPALIDQYIVMPRSIDGSKLVLAYPPGKKRRVSDSTHLALCEIYRVAPDQENRRVLLCPPDSVAAITDKLNSLSVPKIQRTEYLRTVVIPLLQMSRAIAVTKSAVHEAMLESGGMPGSLLDTDPQAIAKNEQRLIETLCAVVLEPVARMIGEKLRELNGGSADKGGTTPPPPLLPSSDRESSSAGNHADSNGLTSDVGSAVASYL